MHVYTYMLDVSNWASNIILCMHVKHGILDRVSSSLVLSANQESLKKIGNLRESIEKVGKDARRTIRKVVEAMTTMESLLVPYNSNMAKSLSVTTHQLGKASRLIQSVVHNNGASIRMAIQTS